MDNAPIHNKGLSRKVLEKNNFELINLPPYTPELNPIENFFNEAKREIKSSNFKNIK